MSTEYAQFVEKHPEIQNIMSDFMQMIVHHKPHDIYQFTNDYFKKM